MRISIWQQWASNHSASFTVIGVFESPQAAQEIRAKWLSLFQSIQTWYSQPDNEAFNADRFGGHGPLSDPERQLREQSGIEWYEQSIDWHGTEAEIQTVDHLLFIQPPATILSGSVLAESVTAWGGSGMLEGSVFGRDDIDHETRHVEILMTCLAPDETTAANIEAVINQQMGRQMDSAGTEVAWSTRGLQMTVTHNGTELRMSDFYAHRLGYAFPALVKWLKHQGCTNFQYTLTETIETEDE